MLLLSKIFKHNMILFDQPALISLITNKLCHTNRKSTHPTMDATAKSLVFFDLETTGLPLTSDITQIAAICEGHTFNQYVMPNQPISPKASELTGLDVVGGVLQHRGKPVDAQDPADALASFMQFLQSRGKPILLGHNITNFDIPVLQNALQRYKMAETLESNISGYVDTLSVARSVIPITDIPTGKYSQESLLRAFVPMEYWQNAHNALQDVISLKALYDVKLSVGAYDISQFLLHL